MMNNTKYLSSDELLQYLFDSLGLSEVKSTESLLNLLCDATEILLQQYDYDGHGHELIRDTVDTARTRIKTLKIIHQSIVS